MSTLLPSIADNVHVILLEVAFTRSTDTQPVDINCICCHDHCLWHQFGWQRSIYSASCASPCSRLQVQSMCLPCAAHPGYTTNVTAVLACTIVVCLQPVMPQSLVKPSGRLEREVAPDLGLAGAAQLGIKLGSQSKPAAVPNPTPSHPPPASKSSSHRSQGHPSTSGRSTYYKTVVKELPVENCMLPQQHAAYNCC